MHASLPGRDGVPCVTDGKTEAQEGRVGAGLLCQPTAGRPWASGWASLASRPVSLIGADGMACPLPLLTPARGTQDRATLGGQRLSAPVSRAQDPCPVPAPKRSCFERTAAPPPPHALLQSAETGPLRGHVSRTHASSPSQAPLASKRGPHSGTKTDVLSGPRHHLRDRDKPEELSVTCRGRSSCQCAPRAWCTWRPQDQGPRFSPRPLSSPPSGEGSKPQDRAAIDAKP